MEGIQDDPRGHPFWIFQLRKNRESCPPGSWFGSLDVLLFQAFLEFAQGLLFDTGHIGARDAEAFRHFALRFAASAAQPVPEPDDDLLPAFQDGSYQAVKLFNSLRQVNLFFHFLIFAAQDVDEGDLIALYMMYICYKRLLNEVLGYSLSRNSSLPQSFSL